MLAHTAIHPVLVSETLGDPSDPEAAAALAETYGRLRAEVQGGIPADHREEFDRLFPEAVDRHGIRLAVRGRPAGDYGR